MKFKIGDKVKIDKESVLEYTGRLPSWYSDNIFIVIGTIDNINIMLLDKNLTTNHDNTIHTSYLKSIKEERKNKLLKLKKL